MKIAGVIAEYNPFHNGHGFHLAQTRAQSRCDAIVAVMSGNFVQRGEPAAFDKWARTRMALECGADAVLELPAFYALQTAEWFAYGGVAVLDGIGADCLSFGSGLPDTDSLERLSAFWDDEPEQVKSAIREGMKEGKSHPKARADALSAYLGYGEASDALSEPNSVLGAMYLRQLRNLGSTMEPLAVKRMESKYNDEEITGAIASATAVRRALFCGEDWRRAVPEAAAAIIDEETGRNAGPLSSIDFEKMVLYALRTGNSIPDIAEGLDNRIGNAATASGSLEELYAAAKCKRYTMARIKRATMQALLGVTAEDITLIRCEKPVYARLLGYSRCVDGLVGELARKAKIPFVARAAEFRPENPAMKRLWELDILAGDIYALGSKNPVLRRGGRDYTEKMIVI